MSNAILSLIGLCKKAGRLEVGEEPVGAAARAHHARLLLVAADAAGNTRRRCAHFAEAGAVPWAELPFSKAELGSTVGRSSCALAAITDIGFASSLAAKLALLDQARYGELSAALDAKAQKALQRQKEQRRHEKNLREGKRKPWAAPPKAQQAPPAGAQKVPDSVRRLPLSGPPRPKAPTGKLTARIRSRQAPKSQT